MIKAKLLNSGASLNSFFELGALEFSPGENLTVVVRLFDSQTDLRYIPPATAALDLNFLQVVAGVESTLTKAASLVDADDRSMWKVTLSQAETAVIVGSGIELELDLADDDVTIFKTVITSALSRITLSGDC